ncbi:Uncharacterized protein TCM_035221 [Theobroma cacao]|uniref:Uncharacterized protein n=1 Tax=Theobroma cacao TaxID=3641 RepID=A0A061FID1_THECC|nr:Uncharacterized protein TCM_035221 [Theobroma cacao]
MQRLKPGERFGKLMYTFPISLYQDRFFLGLSCLSNGACINNSTSTLKQWEEWICLRAHRFRLQGYSRPCGPLTKYGWWKFMVHNN